MKPSLVVAALGLAVTSLAASLAGCSAGADASAHESEGETNEDAIIGGTETFERDAVGVTTLDGSTGCSATLIRPRVILLAGHCFGADRTDIAPWQFEIRKSATESYRYDTGEGWVKGRSAGSTDVALLHLRQAVPAEVATPIPIAKRWPSYGTTLQLLGFGCTQRGGDGAGVKRKLEARYGAAWDLGWVTRATCPGDSGGALLSSRGPELLGVLSGFRSTGYDLFGDAVAHRAELEAQIAVWGE